jgi:DNA-binding transcriptional LysR family regulator
MLDRLTLDQLRVLIAVAETGSFSAAARRLRRVQSAVSQSVQSLETTLSVALFDRSGKAPKLTDAGAALIEDARRLVRGAEALRGRAETIAAGVEPELSLAVDAMFPSAVLMASLRALSSEFPSLAVTLYTEGLGAPEQRLREGTARLAIYAPLQTGAKGLETEFLTSITLVPVVAADHPLARQPAPLTRAALEPHVQLVLTDPTNVTAGFSGGIVSTRIWRFIDLHARLDYLLAGFGWCQMPFHLVEDHIVEGRLKRLDLTDHRGALPSIPLHVVQPPGRMLGPAGRWLMDHLRARLAASRGSPPFTAGRATATWAGSGTKAARRRSP